MATEVARETKSRERRARQERAPSQPSTPKSEAIAAQESAAADWAARTFGPRSRIAEHAVFMIPGLFGFESFSTFGYFADRVGAALRAGLEQTWRQPVPVVAVPIPPTAALADRQRMLVRTLADRLHSLEHGYRPLHVHLVGHSTGGVDANLLTHERPIGGGSWADLDARAPGLLERIRTVVSIGSPHQGACIAADPIARFMNERDPRALPALTKMIGSFALSSLNDIEISQALWSAKREGGKSVRFIRQLLFSKWDLLGDLEPLGTQPAWSTGKARANVKRRSFVTVAAKPKPGASNVTQPDAFFRELSQRASGWSTGVAERGALIEASVGRLRGALASDQADELVIKAAGVELPDRLDAGHNDGVVNVARQLINPNDDDELAGIVAADHFDVVGYYDRHVWALDSEGNEEARHVLSGLLHSGSGFRDNQFFELYRRVANAIA